MNKGIIDIQNGSITKVLLQLFFPIFICNMFQQMSSMLNLIFVGKYVSAEAIGTVGGSSNMLITLFTGTVIALISGCMITVANAYGEANSKRIKVAISTSYVIVILCAILFLSIYEIFSPKLLKLLNEPSIQIQNAINYLRWYSMGFVFYSLFQLTINLLRCLGETKISSILIISSFILNVITDYLFIVILKKEIIGICISFIITQIISLFVAFYFFESYISFDKVFIFSIEETKNIILIGIPAAIISFVFSLTNVYLQSFINKLGEQVVSAYAILIKIENFYWITMTGIDFALCTFTSQNYGANKNNRIIQGTLKGSIIAFAVTFICFVGMSFLNKQLSKLFVSDLYIIDIASYMMRFMAPLYFAYTIIEVLFAVFKGIGKAIIPTYINLICVCGVRFIWLTFIASKNLAFETVQMCYPISWLLTSIAYIIYYQLLKKKYLLNEAQ